MALGIVGLIPALAIVLYTWAKDPTGRKPFKPMAGLFGIGVLTCVVALVIALGIKALVDQLSDMLVLYLFLDNFIVAAGVEEVTKYFGLCWVHRKRRAQNVYDIMLWGALIGFGFATIENLAYMLSNNAMVAVLRAIFAVPGHVAYGILMGFLLGKSFQKRAEGDAGRAWLYSSLALFVPWMIHGTYDLLIEQAVGLWWIAFLMILVFTISMVVLVKKQAKRDTPAPMPAAAQMAYMPNPTMPPAAYPMQQPMVNPTAPPVAYPMQQQMAYPTAPPAAYPMAQPAPNPTTPPAAYPVQQPMAQPVMPPNMPPSSDQLPQADWNSHA